MVKKVPEIIPSETSCCFDLEGVLMENNVLFYLFRYKPFLAIKSLLNGFVKAAKSKIRDSGRFLIEDWIKECKIYYEGTMDKTERHRLGELIFTWQSKEHKRTLMDLLKAINDDGYEVYVITSANQEITHGFLESLPKELHIPRENIFASNETYINGDSKASIVKNIKSKTNKKIVFFTDTKDGEKALEESDVPCVFLSSQYYLRPCKIGRGYRFDSLYGVKSFFDIIHHDLYMIHPDKLLRKELKLLK